MDIDQAKRAYHANAAQDQIERHLERRLKCTIGTLNPDGSIHLAFVIFLWENGKLYFETSSVTKKARNVAANPIASFAFESGDGFMAMAEGNARLIEGDEAQAINARLREKYLSQEAVASVGAAWGEIDDVAVEITPTKWRSWNSSNFYEISGEAAPGLSSDQWWKGPD
jgi:PPOX class probable F420-dependent enzyme